MHACSGDLCTKFRTLSFICINAQSLIFIYLPESGLRDVNFRQYTKFNQLTMRALAERYLSRKKGKFYCCFVDFSNAFDTVNRKHLIHCLNQNGSHGKLLKIIRSIYEQVEAAVRINQSITDFFFCKLGVTQGCLISPRLFIIFINELEKELKNSNCRGTSLASAVGIFLLMYANDIALIADTSVEIQRKLKALESFCQKWGIEVNMAKTKIIVFRNGGKLSSKEKFLYNGKTVDIVTHYKYLGIVFNSRLTWGHES